MKAKDFIDIIFDNKKKTPDEWRKVRKELDEWARTASEEELDEFADSGAGESLRMLGY